MEMHDHFPDQAEGDCLRPQDYQEHPQQQERTVRKGFAFQALNTDDQQHRNPPQRGDASDEPEEAEWLLSEAEQEEKAEQVDQTPEVDAGSIHASREVTLVLREIDFLDPEAFPRRDERQKPGEVSVERYVFQ
jgi:hypothetical protein